MFFYFSESINSDGLRMKKKMVVTILKVGKRLKIFDFLAQRVNKSKYNANLKKSIQFHSQHEILN